MHRKRSLYISLLVLAIIVAAFYAWQSTQRLESLNELEIKLETEKANHDRTELYGIDSILLAENYSTALKLYKDLIKQENDYLEHALLLRTKVANKLMWLEAEYAKSLAAQEDSIPNEIDSISAVIHQSYLRKMDSLDFAISKAKMQVENLKTQLANQTGEGYIKFTNAKGKTIYYVGETQKQTAHGKGVGLYESGSRYEGDWFHNKRHGNGKFYWPDGEKYEGAYLNDKRDGFGTYYWQNGEMYRGQWKEDYRSGKGVFFGADGEVIAKGIWKQDELIEVNKD